MPAATTQDIIKQKFTSRQIKLSDDWLEQCLEWIEGEYGTLTNDEIEAKVYEEWLQLDFCEVQEQILPANLNKAKSLNLNQKFHLQMQYIVDISLPKYQQFHKISKSNTDHIEDVKSSRVLKLVLTDGVQEINAIEHKFVASLNVNLPPGTKVCLCPPIKVRLGQIWLEPNGIVVCGGEVQDLAIPNCQENVLARALNLPLNNNPLGLAIEAINLEENNAEANAIDVIQPEAPPIQVIQSRFNSIQDYVNDFTQQERTNNNVNRQKTNILSAQEKRQENNFGTELLSPSKKKKPNSNTIKNYLQRPTTKTNDSEDVYARPLASTSNARSPSPLSEPESNPKNTAETSIVKRPILTIEKLISMRPNVHKGNFAINAKFNGVVEKMKIVNSEENEDDYEWSLKIKVADATGSLEVYVHPLILTEFTEVSSTTLKELRESRIRGDSDFRETMMLALQRCRQKLLDLNGEMMVQIEVNKEPLVIRLNQDKC